MASKLKKIQIVAATMLALNVILPTQIKAEDLAEDEIQIVEFRNCNDEEANWSEHELSLKVENGDIKNCYLNRPDSGSTYAFTYLYENSSFYDSSKKSNPAFRLNVNSSYISPALNRLDISKKELIDDSKAKCTKNNPYTEYEDSEAILAGIGAIVAAADRNSKGIVSNNGYYFGSVAMSQFIADKTGDSKYKVNDSTVKSSTYFNEYYDAANIEYQKALTEGTALLDKKVIASNGKNGNFTMTYAYHEDGTSKLYKSSNITFKNMKFFDGLIKNDYKEPIFTYSLKNVDTGETYNDYVYAAYMNDKSGVSAGEYDIVYQFGICNDLNFQENDYENCKTLDGKTLPNGNYELKVYVADSVSYKEVNNIYTCSSTNYSSKTYTPVVLANNESGSANVGNKKQIINYTLTSTFTVNYDTTPSTPDDEDDSTGSIKISVVDKDKKLLENVKFKICTDKDCENEKYNVTSTDEAYSVPNVPFDTYYVKIISVPDGYVLPKEEIKLELTAENPNITKTITIEATTKVPDTLSNISKLLILCGIVGIISGTILVYTNAKKQEQV